jgi:hypothetical protein
MKERRTARRYDLSLPISIHLHVDDEVASRTGKSRDISIQGVYFTIDSELNAGAELDLTMTFPAEITGATEVFIRATGKVVRVDKLSGDGGQPVGVAAMFEVHEIVGDEADIA